MNDKEEADRLVELGIQKLRIDEEAERYILSGISGDGASRLEYYRSNSTYFDQAITLYASKNENKKLEEFGDRVSEEAYTWLMKGPVHWDGYKWINLRPLIIADRVLQKAISAYMCIGATNKLEQLRAKLKMVNQQMVTSLPLLEQLCNTLSL